MNWKKLGLLIVPGAYDWMRTHAQSPFAEQLDDGLFKIHFVGRDSNNCSRGGSALLRLRDSSNFNISLTPTPTLDIGELGCFDDCGVMPSSIVHYNNLQFMYYTGWSKAISVPFRFFIGLAISHDNGATFSRYSKAPIFGPDIDEPFLTASPWVMKCGNQWKMWYVSGTKWEKYTNKAPKHYYCIKYAESQDGIKWKSKTTCINYEKDEYALARPVVYYHNKQYIMWFSFRGGEYSYKIGYATSEDGINWIRNDNIVGIAPSEKEWDSDMIC